MEYLKLVTYLLYLAVSIVLTVWVARTLFKNGQVFLDDAFADERLADSVNHLLVVGFYLLNLGYIAVALKITGPIADESGAVEALAMKLGTVLLVLGGVHFFNLFVLSRFRRRRMLDQAAPPVEPTRMLPPHVQPVPAGWGQPMRMPMAPPFPPPPPNRPVSGQPAPQHRPEQRPEPRPEHGPEQRQGPDELQPPR